ncbi:hypothetical protein V2J09_000689 [Rumex salicifolius]
MAGHLRDQVLSLLAAANNHGDLAVKLSSLRQVRDLLSSMDSSLAAEVFPYLVELQSSPESLVRKLLIEVMEEVGLKGLEHSAILMPVLFSLIKDPEPIVARQSIVSGIKFFYAVLEDIAMQLHRRGEVERWTEGMWTWMTRIKDAIYSILFETTSLETKLLAMKFMETLVLIFTSDESNLEKSTSGDNGCAFNVSWLITGVSFVNPTELTSEANKFLFTFLDMLRSPNNLPGPLASIARKRTTYHYATVFSALLELNGNYEVVKGGHASSLQFSVRCAFLGFLRSTHPVIIKSRESLVRALRGMNAGDAADQVLRQVDKTLRNQERALHDARATEDSKVINQQPLTGDALRKRPILDEPNSMEMAYKRLRPNSNGQSSHNLQANDYGPEHSSSNGALPKASMLSSSLHPVEQMIAMIAALLAEGERGAQSLELLISQIHPDLLADIVIANMKHLPKSAPLTNYGTFPVDTQNSSLSGSAQVVAPVAATSMQALPLSPQGSITSAAAVITSVPDLPSSLNQADSKRDPRRDPRRVDPRRVPTEPPTQHIKEEAVLVQSELDIPASSSVPNSLAGTPHEVNSSAFLSPSSVAEREINGGSLTAGVNRIMPEDVELNEAEETPPSLEISVTKDYSLSSPCALDEKKGLTALPDNELLEAFSASRFEPDELSPSVSNASESEESCQDLPPVPAFVDLSMEQQQMMREEAVKRVVGSTKKIESTDCFQMRMAIVARLVSQVNDDDHVASLLQEVIVLDYQHQQGHELLMHVLYHLHSRIISESIEQFSVDDVYERLLLGVTNSLLETLPASDKSFSRLLGEAPVLTNSVLELLDKICCSEGSDQRGKDKYDGDRVTQGLGAAWSLILGRPLHRKTCLNIALKCAIHVQDDTRTKAIRLVANKLYPLKYLTDDIEQFARNMLMSAVDQATDSLQSGSSNQRQLDNGEASVSGSQLLECEVSIDNPVKAVENDSAISITEAQRLISLYFALCIKAIHRHISTLIRALGSSNTELLRMISDPPKGCENLLMLMLTEQTPSSDLITTVKHLYETKVKDASILIPVLSSFSKNEVLPIFPRLVGLPLDKFQSALAHILQGSAHTGPALTPAEVIEACSACFEQRTVFTHQVLARALNQMVDRNPLPLLFMRTVIQSIDAFPTLIWKMPKLWVGFLKCVSQTQPHSFRVLLELPPPQLESALNKHPNLRRSLAGYANQPSIRTSMPRYMDLIKCAAIS